MKRDKYQIRVNGEWYTGIAAKNSQITRCTKKGEDGEEETVEDVGELLVRGAAALLTVRVTEGFLQKDTSYLGKISGIRADKDDSEEVLLSMCDDQIEVRLPVEDIVALQLYAPAEGLSWVRGV